MNITIDLDDLTLCRLDHAARNLGGRDIAIWRALNQWLIEQDLAYRRARIGIGTWPPEVIEFQGIPELPPFESYRAEFKSLHELEK